MKKFIVRVWLVNIILCITALTTYSCEDSISTLSKGTQRNDKPVWVRSLVNNGSVTNGVFPVTFTQNKILVLGNDSGKSTIYAYSISGEKLWKWQKFSRPDERLGCYRASVFDNIIMFVNPTKAYGINSYNGQSLWTGVDYRDNKWTTNIGAYYYFTNELGVLGKGDMYTGQTETLYSFNRSDIGFRPPAIWIESVTKDTLLVCTASESNTDTTSQWFNRVYLLLYNFTKRNVIYQKLIRDGYSSPVNGFVVPNNSPVIYQNKIYTAIGKSIQCNDIATGNLVWRKTFEGNFFLSNLIVAGDKIVGNSDDDGILYGLDPTTGNTLWRAKTRSAAGDMYYLKGIVYIIGRGDGALHIVDTQNGKHLGIIESPENLGADDGFTGNVTGNDEYIFFNSYRNLYCYKAAK